jgi:hypothetical protein
MAFVPRFLRRPPAAPEGASGEPSSRPPRPPTPGQLRRERRGLIRAREDRIRDLGGIMLEMYKRDRFNHELVTERCDELIAIERRLQEVDGMLTQVAVARRAPAGSSRCVCGAPVIFGSHFCANCGRAVGEAPVVTCPHCASPLPAEAVFCARCGSPTAEDRGAAYRPPAREPEPEPEPAPEPEAQAQG